MFQSKLIKRIEHAFPGCIILKNDPLYWQGIPDLTIFYKDKWAMLECKASEHAHIRPNQKALIERLGSMSYAGFVYPENVETVMCDLFEVFGHDIQQASES